MDDKKLELSFCSYGCVLDDACRLGDAELIDKVLGLMAEKKFLDRHEKIKRMKGSLDVNACNAVLDRPMMRERKMVEEAVGVFEYMKEMDAVNSKSFVIMIHGLCRVKEMKKAMSFVIMIHGNL